MDEKVKFSSAYYAGAASGFCEEIRRLDSNTLNIRLEQFIQMKDDFIVMENLLLSLYDNEKLPDNIRDKIINTLK